MTLKEMNALFGGTWHRQVCTPALGAVEGSRQPGGHLEKADFQGVFFSSLWAC